jgi:muramoyltetrapeptide carboxypeptidase
MDIPTIHPPRLKIGDTIVVIAPASPIESHMEAGKLVSPLDSGIATIEKMGFRVRFDERIFQSSRYLAGSDVDRAEELMRAFENHETQGIIAVRGGYGCSRLIPLLQERRLRNFPKIFMGFSDLTTLHMFFRRRFGWITFHGPMAKSIGGLSFDQETHLLSLLTDPDYRPLLSFEQLETWEPGIAEGILAGGCLSIVATSIGTSYEIKTEGKILFLEDLGEPPYRLDRTLTHLRLAGKMDGLAGLLLGDFLDCEPVQGGYSAKEALREVLKDIKVPIMAGFPAGHGLSNWAIPLGVRIRMNATNRSIEFLEPAVS